MGLAHSVLRTLIRMHRRRPLLGPVLTLGVQDVHATYEDLVDLFQAEGTRFCPVAPAARIASTSRFFDQAGLARRGFVHARVFFRMLGIESYDALDFAGFEQPTILHDLNEPVPLELHGRFGLVLDGGTLEHIMDIRTAMANIVRLTRLGGDVVHVSPVAGWANHGFYQLSPCLFYDFYACNGFGRPDSCLVELPKMGPASAERIVPYEHDSALMETRADLRILLVLRTQREVDQPLCIPTQGIYQDLRRAG